MANHKRRWSAPLLFVVALTATPCSAVETHVWDQSELSDFARGTLKSLSLRSDGHITLAPSFRELSSTSVPYLWALAQDSAGTLYYAGGAPTGPTAKVYRLPARGKAEVLAEVPGLEIHALALDKQNRLYAAVLPDAKIYRIDRDGKPQLFFDPKCKYIWAMAFDRSGNLFVATGETGLIYRVAPDGTGTKFFDSEETHVRSLIIDSNGNLIVGTEPSGLVLRITPEGQSFVLYETNKREVTSVAERNGVIYATSVGNKSAAAVVSGPSPVLPSTQPPVSPAGTPRTGPTQPPAAPPPVGSFSATVTGGSELYRIGKDGYAERIWQSSSDLAYALAFDPSGHPLIGTGNKGVIYRIDSDQIATQLLSTPPTQVTGFLQRDNGTIYAVTGNVGNLYALAPEMERTGTLTSDVLDAREFTYWGKAHVHCESRGGTVSLETRSGNLNNPENNWSPWMPVAMSAQGGQVQSPPGRFLQYRLTLKAAGGESPDVSAIDIAYVAKNVAPRIRVIEVAPLNYRQAPGTNLLERNVNAAGSPGTLTLPAVGQRRSSVPSGSLEGSAVATLQYSKGYITVRWSASDANDDPLQFKVELRAKSSQVWRTLKEKLTDRYYAFDTTAFPDGQYVARVTATDAGGNTPADALTGTLESDPFHIDNTPPEILDLKVSPSGAQREISFIAKDATSWIGKAEYSLDGNEWVLLNPLNRVTDSQALSYQLQAADGQLVAIRVFDENDNVVVKQISTK